MQRPNPTKQLIMDITGGNTHLLECIHHGLFETNLSEVYKVLDLKELLAFAGGSWKRRSTESLYITKNKNLYDIFSSIYKNAMPWINENISITPKQKIKYKKTNPFKGKDLKSRLEQVDEERAEKLKESLVSPVHNYVFDCNYSAEKRRLGTNYNLHSMGFQNAYPKRGRIGPAYASEIARMLKRYSQTYLDTKNLKSEKEDQKQNTQKQTDLFS